MDSIFIILGIIGLAFAGSAGWCVMSAWKVFRRKVASEGSKPSKPAPFYALFFANALAGIVALTFAAFCFVMIIGLMRSTDL